MRSIGFPNLLVVIVMGIVLLVGALPSMVGWRKRDRLGIVIFNLLAYGLLVFPALGMFVWIGALLWAFLSPHRGQAAGERGEAIARLDLVGDPVGEQRVFAPVFAYGSGPRRSTWLPTWLLTALFALIFLGLMYLAVGYFRDTASPATPTKHSRRSSDTVRRRNSEK
jgi:hypothetical protein